MENDDTDKTAPSHNQGNDLADVMAILSQEKAAPVVEALRADPQAIITAAIEILQPRQDNLLQRHSSVTRAVIAQITAIAAKDPTLVRLWFQYNALIATVKRPEYQLGYRTAKEAGDARKLANAYFRGRERQAKLHVELIPENEVFIRKVRGGANMFSRYNTKNIKAAKHSYE